MTGVNWKMRKKREKKFVRARRTGNRSGGYPRPYSMLVESRYPERMFYCLGQYDSKGKVTAMVQ